MTYRDDIIARIKAINLPAREYVVIAGGSLAVHNLRAAGDIDLIVSGNLFEKLHSQGWELRPWTHKGRPGKDWLRGPDVEAYREVTMQYGTNPSFQVLVELAEEIEGILFCSLQQLIEFKKDYGREKDLADIALIEKFLQSSL